MNSDTTGNLSKHCEVFWLEIITSSEREAKVVVLYGFVYFSMILHNLWNTNDKITTKMCTLALSNPKSKVQHIFHNIIFKIPKIFYIAS